MRKPEIILVGAGGHSKACIDVIENEDKFDIAGLVGLPDEVGKQVLDYSIIATDADLSELVKQYKYAFVTQGQIKSPENRLKIYNKLENMGFQLPCIVSKTAYVSSRAEICAGTIVMHRVVINADVKIGSNCIINTSAVIEHDVRIGNHTHISTGVILNGNVTVAEHTFLGSNTVVKNGIKIGASCVIGMGLSIKQDVSDQTTLKGR
ncbi:MAG: acetyltransferase [Oligoflexia bacterium]|nr:acetyltransferase [Oligoflexia bacterium]